MCASGVTPHSTRASLCPKICPPRLTIRRRSPRLMIRNRHGTSVPCTDIAPCASTTAAWSTLTARQCSAFTSRQRRACWRSTTSNIGVTTVGVRPSSRVASPTSARVKCAVFRARARWSLSLGKLPQCSNETFFSRRRWKNFPLGQCPAKAHNRGRKRRWVVLWALRPALCDSRLRSNCAQRSSLAPFGLAIRFVLCLYMAWHVWPSSRALVKRGFLSFQFTVCPRAERFFDNLHTLLFFITQCTTTFLPTYLTAEREFPVLLMPTPKKKNRKNSR